MVDEGRLGRLLRAVSDRTQRLRAAHAAIEAGNTDDLTLDAVKYLFVTTIEGCVDGAHHICAAEGVTPPDTNADAVRRLGDHGVIDRELAATLARAVGFRNVLVHQYADVDDRIVFEMLGRLDDFDQFVGEVSRWLIDTGR